MGERLGNQKVGVKERRRREIIRKRDLGDWADLSRDKALKGDSYLV
jgi:hypothetical protein